MSVSYQNHLALVTHKWVRTISGMTVTEEKMENSTKTHLTATSSITNPTQNGLGLNPGPHGQRLTTNHPSHGTACWTLKYDTLHVMKINLSSKHVIPHHPPNHTCHNEHGVLICSHHVAEKQEPENVTLQGQDLVGAGHAWRIKYHIHEVTALPLIANSSGQNKYV